MIFVAIGGFTGAIFRFLLSKWIGQMNKQRFPWPTFIINSSGSFALGAFLAGTPSTAFYYLVASGFLGSFTTFSTFSYEATALLLEKKITCALLYIGSSAAIGIIAASAGFYISQ
ncbi:MAG: CrcB family protein [Solibacillus sp.]